MFKVRVNWETDVSSVFECIHVEVERGWIKLSKQHGRSTDIEYETDIRAMEVYELILDHLNGIENFKVFAVGDNMSAMNMIFEMPE